MKNDLLISHQEAAVLVGVCSDTLRVWNSQTPSYFPSPIYVGQKKFYRRSDVESFLNSEDRIAPRSVFGLGEGHHNAKYPDEFIAEIKRLHSVADKSYNEISRIMSVPKSTVAMICRGERRAHNTLGAPL